MKNSAIEWCDHTFNPWEGCTKVSPGCAHCYAETRNARFGGGTAPNWGKGAPRRRTSVQNWNQVRRWNREASRDLNEFAMTGAVTTEDGQRIENWHRPRVFCASLADVFDEEVPNQWRADLFRLIDETPNLDWLLLTKRPENVIPMLFQISNTMNGVTKKMHFAPVDKWARHWIDGRPPANVWLGTTVEDQQRADERIPELLEVPARVRFLSCEPLLTHVNAMWHFANNPGKIHWVICGGESGHGARPMHPQWATSLRDQCKAAGVPFLFKQWGEWAPREVSDYVDATKAELRHLDEFTPMYCIGKKAAGRLLNGIEHNGFPNVG
jgi:protein gp37